MENQGAEDEIYYDDDYFSEEDSSDVPPAADDSENENVVEEILNERRKRGVLEMFVRWSSGDRGWVTVTDEFLDENAFLVKKFRDRRAELTAEERKRKEYVRRPDPAEARELRKYSRFVTRKRRCVVGTDGAGQAVWTINDTSAQAWVPQPTINMQGTLNHIAEMRAAFDAAPHPSAEEEDQPAVGEAYLGEPSHPEGEEGRSAVPPLSSLCVRHIAEDLSLHPNVRMLPVRLKGRVYAFMVKLHVLRSRQDLEALLDPYQTLLDLSVAARTLAPDAFEALRTCTSLRVLKLGGCRITDEVFENSVVCSGLEELDVSSCRSLPLITPASTGLLPCLRQLNLSGSAIRNPNHIVRIMQECPALTRLDAANLKFDWPDADKGLRPRCTDLRRLDLSHSPHDTTWPYMFGACAFASLEELRLEGAHRQATLLSAMESCPNLRTLSLVNNPNADATTAEAIARCVGLRWLDLTGTQLKFFGILPITLRLHLRNLAVSNLSPEAVMYVLYCPFFGGLEKLTLAGCAAGVSHPQLMIDVLQLAAQAPPPPMPHLRTLNLLHSTRLCGEEFFRTFAPCWPGLRTLHLDSHSCDDPSAHHLAASCPLLTDVELPSTNITDAGVYALLSGCLGLTRLVLSGCHAVTDLVLTYVRRGAPSLSELRVDCTRVTPPAAESFAETPPPALRSLHVCRECWRDGTPPQSLAVTFQQCAPRFLW